MLASSPVPGEGRLGTKLCDYKLWGSLIPRISCMDMGMRLSLRLTDTLVSYPQPCFQSPCTFCCNTVHTTVPTVYATKSLGRSLGSLVPRLYPLMGGMCKLGMNLRLEPRLRAWNNKPAVIPYSSPSLCWLEGTSSLTPSSFWKWLDERWSSLRD